MIRRANKFYTCDKCNNLVKVIADKGSPVVCCGNTMRELIPNTTDASQEKHVPEIDFAKNILRVKVGNVSHPMVEEHSIEWVYIESTQGDQFKPLKINKDPEVDFALVNGDKPTKVYAYCNLHGLWETEI